MIGGCSVLLPAGSGGWVDLGTVAARNFTSSPFTIMAWVFPTALAGFQVIMSNGSTAVGGYDFLTSDTFTFPYALRFRTNSPANAWTESSVPLVLNRWQHVAAVRDGANATIYIDGEDRTGIKGVHADPVAWGSNSSVGSNPSGAAAFNGAIDEPAWFNRALTQAEIRRLMYAQLTGSESGLVSYHRFDDGLANYASTTATAVVSGVNGTLVGMATWVFDRWAPWIEPRVRSTANVLINSTAGAVVPGTKRAFIPTVDSRLFVHGVLDATVKASGSGSLLGFLLVNGAPVNPPVWVWTPTASTPRFARTLLSQVLTLEAPASSLLTLELWAQVTGSMTSTLGVDHTGYAIVAMPKYGTW